jgi:hypothetical protein
MDHIYIWIGIALCLTQSAVFSGLNLAFFSLTRLRLEIEAQAEHSERASKVLELRKDSNFLLSTILWGNVGVNVLLTLLSESVMVGLSSFLFSTIAITMLGEIIPQAYFSRHALRMASFLSPLLRFYQFILFPIAKPCAIGLDRWLGKESAQFFTEENIGLFIKKHMEHSMSEIEHTEGLGAINFLMLDDRKVWEEGEIVTPQSIINLTCKNGQLYFPEFQSNQDDPFIQRINVSGEKWVVFTDEFDEPKLVLDADGYLRSEVLEKKGHGLESYCHKPIVVYNQDENLGAVIRMMRQGIKVDSDLPIEKDIVLYWKKESKRVITGSDLFGSLLKGI